MLTRPIGVVLALFLIAPRVAEAAPKHDIQAEAEVERLEIAREHFQKGEELAKAGSLQAALIELELAEVAHPSAMVTEAKRRVRAQLDALRPEVGAVAVEPAPIPPPARGARLRRFIAPIVVAPIALGTFIAGAALLGVERSEYDHLRSTCSPGCAPSEVDPVRTREKIAVGLLGAGGALMVVDALMWGLLARNATPSVRASAVLDPQGGGLVVKGAF